MIIYVPGKQQPVDLQERWPSWLKAPLSKSGILLTRDRGFESLPLRHCRGFGVVRFGVVRSGVVRSGVVRSGVIRSGLAAGLPEKIVCLSCGEMTELAEGARLEIVCALTGTEGSNPSLSATFICRPPIRDDYRCDSLEKSLIYDGQATSSRPLQAQGNLNFAGRGSHPAEFLW